MKTNWVVVFIAAMVAFIAGVMLSAYYLQPKVVVETFQRYWQVPANAVNAVANSLVWYFEYVYHIVTTEPLILYSLIAVTCILGVLAFYALMKVAKEHSKGLRKWVGFVGFVYAAIIAYLCHTNAEFIRAKKLLLPIAALLTMLIVIAWLIARAAEKAGLLPVEKEEQNKLKIKAPRKIKKLLKIIWVR